MGYLTAGRKRKERHSLTQRQYSGINGSEI
jgi:hypothetical protein